MIDIHINEIFGGTGSSSSITLLISLATIILNIFSTLFNIYSFSTKTKFELRNNSPFIQLEINEFYVINFNNKLDLKYMNWFKSKDDITETINEVSRLIEVFKPSLSDSLFKSELENGILRSLLLDNTYHQHISVDNIGGGIAKDIKIKMSYNNLLNEEEALRKAEEILLLDQEIQKEFQINRLSNNNSMLINIPKDWIILNNLIFKQNMTNSEEVKDYISLNIELSYNSLHNTVEEECFSIVPKYKIVGGYQIEYIYISFIIKEIKKERHR